MSHKIPLNDDQAQEFIDNLPDDQANSNAEQKLDKAIAHASRSSRK